MGKGEDNKDKHEIPNIGHSPTKLTFRWLKKLLEGFRKLLQHKINHL